MKNCAGSSAGGNSREPLTPQMAPAAVVPRTKRRAQRDTSRGGGAARRKARISR